MLKREIRKTGKSNQNEEFKQNDGSIDERYTQVMETYYRITLYNILLKCDINNTKEEIVFPCISFFLFLIFLLFDTKKKQM